MDNVLLLADMNSNAWGFAESIRNHIFKIWNINAPLSGVRIDHFRNGEIDMEVPENVRKKDVYFIGDSSKNPQEWWVELLLVRDLLNRSSANSITFVLPNMMYSRKDWKDKPHVPISAGALAASLNNPSYGPIERIITMDIHAPQIQGFYQIPVDALYSFPDVIRHFSENTDIDLKECVVVSSDVGGAGRVRSFSKRCESKYPIAIIDKSRSKPGEAEAMNIVGDVQGKDVIVVDDMIDSGGTLRGAAKILRESGARRLICYGTHGIFTNNCTEWLPKEYDLVFTTNTISRDPIKGINVIDVSGTFGEAIFRAQKGMSISKLFK